MAVEYGIGRWFEDISAAICLGCLQFFAKGSIHGDIFTKDNREYNASIINVWDKMRCTYSPKI